MPAKCRGGWRHGRVIDSNVAPVDGGARRAVGRVAEEARVERRTLPAKNGAVAETVGYLTCEPCFTFAVLPALFGGAWRRQCDAAGTLQHVLHCVRQPSVWLTPPVRAEVRAGGRRDGVVRDVVQCLAQGLEHEHIVGWTHARFVHKVSVTATSPQPFNAASPSWTRLPVPKHLNAASMPLMLMNWNDTDVLQSNNGGTGVRKYENAMLFGECALRISGYGGAECARRVPAVEQDTAARAAAVSTVLHLVTCRAGLSLLAIHAMYFAPSPRLIRTYATCYLCRVVFLCHTAHARR
ncbi:hypothetical protein TRVL_03360 [Trypanosoma vivax]|nr:hypothetical protein TRVL_03360 [Trypanosoma vivax]